MTRLFKIVTLGDPEAGVAKGWSIGIDVKIADREIVVPVTSVCRSYDEALSEVERIKNDLTGMLGDARAFFAGPTQGKGTLLTAQMSAGEIWSVLSTIPQEVEFVGAFNSMDEAKRREVGEYILTKCNIFSGRASVFSARYDTETGLME
jgi:hypothetical protein